MFTDNTIHKINKNNPAEMDRNGSKAYRVPIQLANKKCHNFIFIRFSTITLRQ